MALPATLAASLAAAADSAIVNALTNGGGGVPAPKGEVAAVAAIVLGAVPNIAAAWKPILAGSCSCSITGVFVHGSPQVEFHNGKGAKIRCELGDLLVVVDELKGGAVADRRANIIQAKLVSSSGSFKLGGSGAKQLELYRHWHPFTFVPTMYGTGPRDFRTPATPGVAVNSGAFGGIDLIGSTRSWIQTVPGPTMTTHGGISLGAYMAGMATAGPEGRLAHVGGSDDWSTTIDELLLRSAPLFSRFGVGLNRKARRGVVATALMASSAIIYRGGATDLSALRVIARDPPPPADENSRWPRDSISTIHVIFNSEG